MAYIKKKSERKFKITVCNGYKVDVYKRQTVLSALRQGALLLPALYLLHALLGLPGLAAARAVADMLGAAIAALPVSYTHLGARRDNILQRLPTL